MSEYRLASNVVAQHNTRIPQDSTIKGFIASRIPDEPFDHTGFFFALSQQGKIFTLNLTASIILEELLEGTPQDEMINILSENFDVSEEQAANDIEGTIDTLCKQGLLVAV